MAQKNQHQVGRTKSGRVQRNGQHKQGKEGGSVKAIPFNQSARVGHRAWV
ncbi:MAG: hypothetical protein RLZZ517_161 [Candidatus Parcubacteria bacterium]|jgi:hypothetical protein